MYVIQDRLQCCTTHVNKSNSRRFETTLSTLFGVPFFEPLIEGRIPYAKDEDGYIFIDRDGAMFEIILQWLRSKQRPTEHILKTHSATLLDECEFYCLDHLSDIIRGHTCAMDLRFDDRQIREHEMKARKDSTAHQGMLMDVHKNTFEYLPRDCLELPLLFADVPRSYIKGGFQEFYERLNTFSGNLLTDLKDIGPGLIIAGGSVLGALTGCFAGDLDVFLKVSVEEAEPMLMKIYAAVLQNQAHVSQKRVLITRTKNAVSFYRIGANNTRCPPVQVITSVIECNLAMLLDFDVDSCCFAFDHDKSQVFTTARGMRALKYGVNIVDSHFASPCYWRRLGKYVERGFSIAVPGYLKERALTNVKNQSYVFIPKYELLLHVGCVTPGKEVDVAYTENPLTQKRELMRVKATAQQIGTVVKGLERLTVLDFGVAKFANTPSRWLCLKHERIVCDTGISGCCTPISSGILGEYVLLWGVEPHHTEATEIEDDEIEGYQSTPMAAMYGLLEKAFHQNPQSMEPEGWFKGGIMQKLEKEMTKANTSGVYQTAIECNASRTVIGYPLLFVYDIVGVDTKFKDLKYILDAAHPPLKDSTHFEKIYGLPRLLKFHVRTKRQPVDANMFANVY